MIFFLYLIFWFKGIKEDKIYLSIDLSLLDSLDTFTKSKTIKFHNKEYSFLEYFKKFIHKENFIECSEFENKFKRTENDLVFFASGHGAVKG